MRALFLIKNAKGNLIPCNRPSRSIVFWDVEAPIFCLDNRLIDGCNVASPTRPPLYLPGRFLLLISVKGWVDPRDIILLEGLGKLKYLPDRDSIPLPSGYSVPHIFTIILLLLMRITFPRQRIRKLPNEELPSLCNGVVNTPFELHWGCIFCAVPVKCLWIRAQLSLRNWQLQNIIKKGIRLWKNTSCTLQ
jgi:hypothetical protein